MCGWSVAERAAAALQRHAAGERAAQPLVLCELLTIADAVRRGVPRAVRELSNETLHAWRAALASVQHALAPLLAAPASVPAPASDVEPLVGAAARVARLCVHGALLVDAALRVPPSAASMSGDSLARMSASDALVLSFQWLRAAARAPAAGRPDYDNDDDNDSGTAPSHRDEARRLHSVLTLNARSGGLARAEELLVRARVAQCAACDDEGVALLHEATSRATTAVEFVRAHEALAAVLVARGRAELAVVYAREAVAELAHGRFDRDTSTSADRGVRTGAGASLHGELAALLRLGCAADRAGFFHVAARVWRAASQFVASHDTLVEGRMWSARLRRRVVGSLLRMRDVPSAVEAIDMALPSNALHGTVGGGAGASGSAGDPFLDLYHCIAAALGRRYDEVLRSLVPSFLRRLEQGALLPSGVLETSLRDPALALPGVRRGAKRHAPAAQLGVTVAPAAPAAAHAYLVLSTRERAILWSAGACVQAASLIACHRAADASRVLGIATSRPSRCARCSFRAALGGVLTKAVGADSLEARYDALLVSSSACAAGGAHADDAGSRAAAASWLEWRRYDMRAADSRDVAAARARLERMLVDSVSTAWEQPDAESADGIDVRARLAASPYALVAHLGPRDALAVDSAALDIVADRTGNVQ